MNEKNINEISDYRAMEARERSIKTGLRGLAFIGSVGLLTLGKFDYVTEGVLAVESGAIAGLIATIASYERF